MNNGAFGENFPYTNFHDLNMDWVVKIAKDFLDQYTHIQDLIAQGIIDIGNKTDEGLNNLQTKAEELEGLLQQWYDEHDEDIREALADALEDIQAALTTAMNNLDNHTNSEIARFNTEIASIVRSIISSIPADYSDVSSLVTSLVSTYPLEMMNKDLSDQGNWEEGAWDYGKKTVSASRIRTKFAIYAKRGTTISIYSPTLRVLVGRLSSLSASSYAQFGTYIDPSEDTTELTTNYDGWIVINAIKPDQSSITPSDWDGTITLQNPINEDTVFNERPTLSSSSDDIHNIDKNGTFFVSNTNVRNWPFDETGVVMCLRTAIPTGMYLALTYSGKMKYQYFSSGYSQWFDIETTASVLQRTPALGINNDCNDYNNASGVWYVNNAGCAHWPFDNTGVLVVLKSGYTPLIQLATDYTNKLKIRYKSTGWTEWRDLIYTNYKGNITSGNIDDYLSPGEYTVTNPSAVTNWPSELTGRLINFTNPEDTNRIAQVAIDYQLNVYIRYKSTSLTPWRRMALDTKEYTITVKADGTGDYTTVEQAIKFAMDEYFKYRHYYKSFRILVDEGTYDMSGLATMIANEEIPVAGLFLPPHCKLIGQGKDKTNLVWRYTGNVDEINSNCSLLNGSYDCEIKDLSITIKNLRYCIHSAQNHPDDELGYSVTNSRINDTTLKYIGLKLIHEGFDEGLSPSYNAPAAYGSGSWNGNKKIFINCDFISYPYTAWLNHNRGDLTRPCLFLFENCTFLSKNSALNSTGAGANFISWQSRPINQVIFRNCSMNKFIDITIRTDELGQIDGTSAYQISADTDIVVLDTIVNNVHKMDTWRTGKYLTLTANGNISAYQPVSINTLMSCRPFNSTDPIWGIALNDANSGDPVTIKLTGRFVKSFITNTTFQNGTKISYDTSTGTWIEDNTNPMMMVLNNLLMLIPKYLP